jgi:predicted AlkP superfamily pyrophosphatase or phosphodiesterase
MRQAIKSQPGSIFSYLLLLTGLFLLLECGFFIQWMNFYLGDYQCVANHIAVPKPAIPGIIYFIFIQLSIHFFYATTIWLMARLVGIAINLSWKQIEKLAFSLWVIGLMAALFANQHYFPNSKFACIVTAIITPKLGYGLFILLSLFLTSVFMTAMVGLYKFSKKIFMVLIVMVVGGSILMNLPEKRIPPAIHSPQPNIIIIGIDSLRPDFLQSFGGNNSLPHIEQFLHQSIVFKEAYTPLARTFPAWVSILTGQYPLHNGIRTNLGDQSQLDLSHTLPALLHQAGYHTIFATDESRFSNIDQRYGFDQVIIPPIGFNDFLLGTMNDFPFSNLITNTRLGKYLFPNSYANRGVFTAYDPDAFTTALSTTLNKTPERPLFLAVHFCLPHFPYFWGRRIANDQSVENYKAALRQVDQQFNDFMTLLQTNYLLDNAIIVLLSDHGEALELSGDRVTEEKSFIPGVSQKTRQLPHFYPPSMEKEAVNQSGGHGTDVLGLTQYRVLLAFALFKSHSITSHSIVERASLLDIKPTLLSFLNIIDKKMDGRSLKPLMLGSKLPTEHLFIESDFSPKAIRTVHPEIKQVIFEGIDYFQIDPITARVVVKNDMMKLILSSKQYADLYQDWILALYPETNNHMMPILVNLKTGQWTNDLRSPFAIHSPALYMLSSLKHFYGKNITEVLNS